MKNKYVYFDLCEEFKKHDEYKDVNGELLKSAVISKIKQLDEKTMSIILSFPELRNRFTKKLNDMILLDQQSLLSFFQSREFINNSFTEYTNKIGLTNGLKFLDNSDEVVLDFPYKDCVLLGNQSKEENEGVRQKFFHEVINFQEIDRLFTKKVLCNFQKHTKDGVVAINDFKETDNLVIKGNNLIALHTIQEKFAGKVKLIYIDPPYNTESLKFAYNDKFDQATWLTFMKNRLDVAKNLLKDDGFILIQLDDNQIHYAKLLCDSIFGEENFVNYLTIELSNPNGTKTTHKDKKFVKLKDNILVYQKSNLARINPAYEESDDYDINYNNIIENNIRMSLDSYMKNNNLNYNDVLEKVNKDEIVAFRTMRDFDDHTNDFNNIINGDSNYELVFDLNDWKIYKTKNSKEIVYLRFVVSENKVDLVKFLKERLSHNNKILKLVGDIWFGFNRYMGNVGKEGGVKLKNGKKPEALIERIISSFSNDGDIILDYHLGSGTTCATAHKMGRQYIGIEQLDYGDNDSIKRLNNVIQGDSTGISKVVNWNGGGEFISVELFSLVDEILNQIKQAQTQSEINDIVNLLLSEKYFYYLGINENKIPYEEIFIDDKYNFKNLSIDEQKRILHASIDKNNLYVDLNDLHDNTVKLSQEEKELNEKFYKEIK